MLTVALGSNVIIRKCTGNLFFERHLRKERLQGLWRYYSLGLCEEDFLWPKRCNMVVMRIYLIDL